MEGKKYKSKIKKVVLKLGELIVSGVVFAVIASVLSASFIAKIESKKLKETQLNNLSKLYIGCNKNWVDESFGNPQFISQKDEYLLCAYITDYFVIQVAFDLAESAQAYLITTKENKENVEVEIYDTTFIGDELKKKITLGEFSYYDFPEEPDSILGFITNGNARAFYSETYYFTSRGNYYNYHIASFDFGDLPGTIDDFMAQFDIVDGEIDDEVNSNINKGYQIIANRHENCPNTYGVSNIGVDIEELLFTYEWFNSQQLRNSVNN